MGSAKESNFLAHRILFDSISETSGILKIGKRKQKRSLGSSASCGLIGFSVARQTSEPSLTTPPTAWPACGRLRPILATSSYSTRQESSWKLQNVSERFGMTALAICISTLTRRNRFILSSNKCWKGKRGRKDLYHGTITDRLHSGYQPAYRPVSNEGAATFTLRLRDSSADVNLKALEAQKKACLARKQPDPNLRIPLSVYPSKHR